MTELTLVTLSLAYRRLRKEICISATPQYLDPPV